MRFDPIHVDTDADCLGTEFIFRFTRTLEDLDGLTISSVSMVLLRNPDCVVETRALTRATIGDTPGATWCARGIKTGSVKGRLWFRLSDGQHRPAPEDFEFEVLP